MEKKQHPVYQAIRAAFPHTIPVLTGYLVLGVAYGVLMQTKGYGTPWVLLMCCLAYCGSMQFVAITLLTTAFDPIQAFLMSLMVNARHLFYGISMVEAYQDTGKQKPYLIFALTDETYSLVCSGVPEGADRRWYYLLVSLLDQCYWVAGTALGVAAGALLPFDATGVDFAMTALFVTVFVDQWRSTRDHIPAVLGVLASLACLLLFGPERFLIPAMIVISLVLSLGRKQIEKRDRHD